MSGIHCGVMPVGGVASEDLPEFFIQRGTPSRCCVGAFFGMLKGFYSKLGFFFTKHLRS
jgi:hypothetical protein